MILHELTITAQADGTNTLVNSYIWRTGDDLTHLQSAITKLQEYVNARQDTLRTALMSQPPIETK